MLLGASRNFDITLESLSIAAAAEVEEVVSTGLVVDVAQAFRNRSCRRSSSNRRNHSFLRIRSMTSSPPIVTAVRTNLFVLFVYTLLSKACVALMIARWMHDAHHDVCLFRT